MHPLCGSVAALAVATIYCIWHSYLVLRLRRERTVRERIAYLLWVIADEVH